MDKSTLVVIVNIAYFVIYLTAWAIRYYNNQDKIINRKDPNDIEYFGYSLMGTIIVPIVGITLFRNSNVFNNWFPTTFIIQFVFQFIVLVCFILPDSKITRYTSSYIVMFFLAFAMLNGLFRKDPKYSKIEITQVEIQKLSNDIDEFSKDLTNRIKKVNDDMNTVLIEIKEREKQVKAINDLLKSKENEYKEISAIIEVDKQKAEEILVALNVHPPTIKDRLLDAVLGAFIGWFLTFATRWIRKKKVNN